jgi:hypothetical protein
MVELHFLRLFLELAWSWTASVTDGVVGVCVDPGEMGAILEAGGIGGPGPPWGGKGEQLASDSGGG